MNTLYFRMTWGWDVIAITFVTSVILVVSVCLSYAVGGAIVALLIPVLLYMPYGVGCTEEGVYIRRIKGTLKIPYHEIRGISPIEPSDVFQLRLLGSGGFMGYFGMYRGAKLGSFVLYASQRKGLLLIETERKKYVISCTDSISFMACANSGKLHKGVNQ